MRLTILERPSASTIRDFPTHLESEFKQLKEELSVSVRIESFSASKWTHVEVAGEDSEIVTELISRKFGIAFSTGNGDNLPGTLLAEIARQNEHGLELDLGVEPGNVRCEIPWTHLMAQLADGKAIRPQELIDCYCLYPQVKVSVRVTSKRPDEVEGWLSDGFLEDLAGWITSGLDRIQVFDCYMDEAEAAVGKARLARDIVCIQPLTLTLQSVVCKLGTDAVGLLPKLGHVLRGKKLKPFLPKRILERCRPW